MARAGLRKVTKVVRGKRGATRRSYWVRAAGLANRHRSVIATGALALAAALAAHKRQAIGAGAASVTKSANHWRRYGGATLAGKLVSAVGAKAAEHIGASLGKRVGARVGRRLGRKHVETAREFGGVIGETVAGHFAERHIKHAEAKVVGALRKKNPFAVKAR